MSRNKPPEGLGAGVSPAGCAAWLAELGDYLDHTLPAQLAVAMRGHLGTCPGCRAVLADYQATRGLCHHLGDGSHTTSTTPTPQGDANHGP